MKMKAITPLMVVLSMFFSSFALSKNETSTVDKATLDRMFSGLTYTCVLIGQKKWQDAIDVVNSIHYTEGADNKKASLAIYTFFKKGLDETGVKDLNTENCFAYAAAFLGKK